ncbi:MAG: class I SAM-dependent methyltransferase [Pseudomonadota bacterium]|nr:class I SAM-dependent methyltransferase [Pseudomonadota bacterium]
MPKPGRINFMSPRDVGLFWRSARTDAEISRVRNQHGNRAAFEAAYTQNYDPWGAADPRYSYQDRKYHGLIDYLPQGRRFSRALDLGCGLGVLSQHLARFADEVLALDIAEAAIERARQRATGIPNLRFEQGDILHLPRSLDGGFDLVVLADSLYYLPEVDDAQLETLALRISDLLVPGGLCLLANHHFAGLDRDSRISRRIHRAFTWSPRFRPLRDGQRPFYLVSLLQEAGTLALCGQGAAD